MGRARNRRTRMIGLTEEIRAELAERQQKIDALTSKANAVLWAWHIQDTEATPASLELKHAIAELALWINAN